MKTHTWNWRPTRAACVAVAAGAVLLSHAGAARAQSGDSRLRPLSTNVLKAKPPADNLGAQVTAKATQGMHNGPSLVRKPGQGLTPGGPKPGATKPASSLLTASTAAPKPAPSQPKTSSVAPVSSSSKKSGTATAMIPGDPTYDFYREGRGRNTKGLTGVYGDFPKQQGGKKASQNSTAGGSGFGRFRGGGFGGGGGGRAHMGGSITAPPANDVVHLPRR